MLCAFYQEYENDYISAYTMAQIKIPDTEATTIDELLNEFPKKVREFVSSFAETNCRNHNGELLKKVEEKKKKDRYINKLEKDNKKMFLLLLQVSSDDTYISKIKKKITCLLNNISDNT
jgi:hypothetical protein